MQSLCIGTRDVLLSDALTRPVKPCHHATEEARWCCMQGDSLRRESASGDEGAVAWSCRWKGIETALTLMIDFLSWTHSSLALSRARFHPRSSWWLRTSALGCVCLDSCSALTVVLMESVVPRVRAHKLSWGLT